MTKWQESDPQWAWQTYEPSTEQPWTRSMAAHLYRRAGFGASSKELDDAVAAGPQESVSRMLTGSADGKAFEQQADELAQRVLATNDSKNLSASWLYRILNTPQPLIEKLTLFWHGHFATSADKVADPALMFNQNQLFRRLALGDFSKLALEVSRDPAMLVYLDSATNRKAHPNENYARELMELFCMGEGNYSEKDVQELARCFTGWEIRRGQFRFNRFQHDEGAKSILGKKGSFGGEQGVDVVVDSASTPRFLTGKLFRYFFADEPVPSEALLAPLVSEFQKSGLKIQVLVERMLRSRLFFSSGIIGQKIKSPVEMLVGFLKGLDGSTNAYNLASDLAELGHALFYPPNVKGWDGGRAWINSSTLLSRANAIHRLLHDANTRFAGQSIGEYLQRLRSQDATALVDRLAELFLALRLSPAIRESLTAIVAGWPPPADRRWSELVHTFSTLAEFHFA